MEILNNSRELKTMKRLRIDESRRQENFNMGKVLTLLMDTTPTTTTTSKSDAQPQFSGRVFECKTCNRRFPSFQALGGHRASHKKPKIQLIATSNHNHDHSLTKQRTHECSICGLEFSIGQALGGHMRRHRGLAGDGLFTAPSTADTRIGDGDRKKSLDLDLNLMPPSENEAEIGLLTFRLGLPVIG